jgi:hypothetical protein
VFVRVPQTPAAHELRASAEAQLTPTSLVLLPKGAPASDGIENHATQRVSTLLANQARRR